jgi:hypothetical protein
MIGNIDYKKKHNDYVFFKEGWCLERIYICCNHTRLYTEFNHYNNYDPICVICNLKLLTDLCGSNNVVLIA